MGFTKEDLTVAGYVFGNKKDADLAAEEVKKINFINSRLNFSNPESVKVIYDKMILNRIFVTPVGLDYQRQLRDELIRCGAYGEDEVDPIPLYVVFSQEEEKPVRRRVIPIPEKNYRKEYGIARLIIFILVLCVVAMFAITLKADNPNILNYERAIQDKYASWEQDLTEREATIRAKERELGIENP